MGSNKCTILYITVGVGFFELAVGILEGSNMGSNKCTILYITVGVGIFELAESKVRGNSGQSNLGQKEP